MKFNPFIDFQSVSHKPLYLLLGHPVAQSISPEIHAALFALKGIDAEYLVADVPPERFDDAITAASKIARGFNLTIPHKETMYARAGLCERRAHISGCVNTVRVSGGKLYGFLTDGDGFAAALRRRNVDFTDMRCLVIGTGGAARCVAAELALGGARVTIAGRSPNKAAALAGSLSAEGLDHISWMGLDDVWPGYDMLVNATPVGMYPNTAESPISREIMAGASIAYDLIYNPPLTRFLADAREMGMTCVNGLEMLVVQAAEAQKIWLGVDFSRQEINTVLYTAQGALFKKRLSARGKNSVVLCGDHVRNVEIGRKLAKQCGMVFIDINAHGSEHAPRNAVIASDGMSDFPVAWQESCLFISSDADLEIKNALEKIHEHV